MWVLLGSAFARLLPTPPPFLQVISQWTCSPCWIYLHLRQILNFATFVPGPSGQMEQAVKSKREVFISTKTGYFRWAYIDQTWSKCRQVMLTPNQRGSAHHAQNEMLQSGIIMYTTKIWFRWDVCTYVWPTAMHRLSQITIIVRAVGQLYMR